MEGNVGDAAHVVADRRQDSPRPNSLDEPFLARHALCDGAWFDYFAHSAPSSHIRDSFRLHRSQIAHLEKRWQRSRPRTETAKRRAVLPKDDVDLARVEPAGRDQHDAQ